MMINLNAAPILLTKATAVLTMVLAIGAIAMQPAQAGTAGAGGFTRSSTVDSVVTNNNNGTWTYGYTVNNTSQFTELGTEPSPILVDWELPWFGDAGINLTSIISPNNWAFAIETIGATNSVTGWDGIAAWQDPNDPFYAGPNSPFTAVTQVLHWYNLCQGGFDFDRALPSVRGGNCEVQFQDAIFPGGSLSGFGYDAVFDETDAPYQASWAFLPVRSGDPAFPLGGIPNSPLAQGLQVAIPEPGLLSLLGIGLVAAMLGRRRAA